MDVSKKTSRNSIEGKGCISSCFSKKNKKKNKENGDQDLDGFLSFMQRDQSSNPLLKATAASVVVSRNVSRVGSRTNAYQEPSGSQDLPGGSGGQRGGREERFANLHVIEEIYYDTIRRSDPGLTQQQFDKITWRPYDPSAFKVVKMNMAKGTVGQIHLLQHSTSGYLGVMKVIPPNRFFNARTELNVLSECSSSPFILQVIDAFTSEKTSYIYLEYAPFKTLDDLAQITEGVGSQNAILFAMEILLAIQYLHSRRILHRDIKPENVFLLISGHVKLGDFSSATFIDLKTNKTKGLCGTYVTRPPEVWSYDYYSYPVDVWSFGISLYNIISNTWPIVHASQDKQISHVNRGDIIYSSAFSTEAADLISRSLKPKPGERWTVSQLISHSYFQDLKDPFPAPYSPNELLEMYSFSNTTVGEDLSFIQDMVAHLP